MNLNSQASGCPMSNTQSQTNTKSSFPSSNYLALYHGFTDYNVEADPSAAYIVQENANKADQKDFLAVGGTEMMIHSAKYGNAVIPFRKADVPGFIELTSISHIVPCMAYFAEALAAYPNDDRIQKQIAQYYQSLKNVSGDFAWLDSMTEGVYYDNADKIKEIFHFAIYDTMAFLESCYEDGVYNFRQSYVRQWFNLWNESDPNEPRDVLWKSVMVGTFCLVSADTLSTLVSDVKVSDDVDYTFRQYLSSINWPDAEVFVCGQTGAAASGIEVTTNSTYKLLSAVARYYNSISENPDTSYNGLNRYQCFFAPFVDASKWTLTDDNTIEDAIAYFRGQFNNLNNRVEISTAMFEAIKIGNASVAETIDRMYKKMPSIESMVPIPLSENNSELEIIDSLTRRMAVCMEDYRDTLSDCVMSYICELWKANNYDLSKVKLPGMRMTYMVGELV